MKGGMMRWKVYNLAFRVFGNTRLWPAMPFTYRSRLDQRAVFADITRPDGRTLELDPGETVVLNHKVEHRGLALVVKSTPDVPAREVSAPVEKIEKPARPAEP
jgi:hypothetical protein